MDDRECCEACEGAGKINGETCRYCMGIGWFEVEDDEPIPELFEDNELDLEVEFR